MSERWTREDQERFDLELRKALRDQIDREAEQKNRFFEVLFGPLAMVAFLVAVIIVVLVLFT